MAERVLKTLIRPPKLYIDKEVKEMYRDITEVEKEAAASSYQRIQKLEARQDGEILPTAETSASLGIKNPVCFKSTRLYCSYDATLALASLQRNS